MSRSLSFLIIAVLAGLGVFTLQFFRAIDARDLAETRLAEEKTRTGKLTAELESTTHQVGTLQTDLASAKTELGASREKLSAAELRSVVLEHDLAQVKSVVSVYEQTARALSDEVATLKADLADTRATFASPDAVAAYKNTISELERQLANSRNGAAAPTAAGAATAVFASRPGRSTVLTVGPSGAFVVLNFGSVRGAQIGQKLEVHQGTDIVATVLISDVRTNFSIAQVQPDTLRGVLQKGDLALLIR
jgi:hypothetical protein